MSQIYKTIASGPIPPSIPTTFVTDINSPAVPALNILNVFGNDTTDNNANGIQTDGSSGSNTLTVQLTNRLTGTGTTVGATTDTLFSIALSGTASSYFFVIDVVGFDGTTPSATGYLISGTARTDGVTATVVGTSETYSEDAILVASDVDLIAVGNSVTLVVTGVAGVTLNWNCVGTYVMVV